jgi:tetratricopeptide (TPR) repeat protein
LRLPIPNGEDHALLAHIRTLVKMSKYRCLLLVVVLAPLAGGAQTNTPPKVEKSASSCHVNPPVAKGTEAAQSILQGYGTGGFTIKTDSPEAQEYFNNGMQLGHAFAHRSAVAAFRRAQQLDPACAMCVWGEAWARGPSINFTISDDAQAELMPLVDKAAALAKNNPERERALIAALAKRYKKGGGKGAGDQEYARAMDALSARYPTDNEIAIMTADSWMIPASQENTRDHLDRVIQILEAALQRSPNDTGVIHFYIHATEMDGVGAEALPYAEKLAALTPAASHLVHMPSHVYFGLGRYRDAEKSNFAAVAIDNANAERLKPKGGVFGLNYHDHNVLYGEAASLLDGDVSGGMALARTEVLQLVVMQPDKPFQQLGLGSAYVVFGRYGSPTEVEDLADPGAAMPYARAMWHYARGEFAARNHDVDSVKKEASAIRLGVDEAQKFQDSSSQASAMVDIARLVLVGRAAMLEMHWSDAEAAYRNAAEIQEAKLGTIMDPPAWWYPIRRSVAAALLAAGNPAAAEVEARQALSVWSRDPQSLRVLAESERKLGETEEGQKQIRLAQTNWSGSVERLPLSLL